MDDQTNVTQGGVTIGEGASITIGAGDIVGRDKIINNIQYIQQRALTAAEEASGERALEIHLLAQGVSAYAGRLQAIASDSRENKEGSPYKGLLSYRLNDAEIFFGRSTAIASMLKRLGRGSLTVLHSESGAGKSSLLQAGISPRLIGAGHLPLFLRPYNANPAYVIKRAFIADPSQTPWLATTPLREFLRQVSGVLGPPTALYIILDQAEELFTQLNAEDRAEFVAELAECLNDEGLRVRWLLSMRTEFFGNLANFRPQIQNPFENDYRLNRLNRAEAGEVITEPAKRRGISFEAGLVEELLNDLSTEVNELPPPQIQLVCSGLYDGLPDRETAITRAQYEAAGGATGILRDHLARVMGRDLKPAQRPIAQRIFESLITADGRRAVHTQAELMIDLRASQLKDLTRENVATVLDRLVDSRLLRVQQREDNPGQAEETFELASGLSPEMTAALAYELAHDYLLDQIKLDPDMQARKAAQELLDQETRTYERHKTLLSPERLAVIEPHRAALRLTPLAEELLTKSEAEVLRAEREEEARRQKELADARKLAEEQKRAAEAAEKLAEAERRQAEERALADQQRLEAAQKIAEEQRRAAKVATELAEEQKRVAEAAHKLAETEKQRAEEQVRAGQQLRRRNRLIASAGVIALLLAITAGVFAVQSTLNAQRADQNAQQAEQNALDSLARQLSSQALALPATQLDRSLLLGVLAYSIRPDLQSYGTLLNGIEDTPALRFFLRGHTAQINALAFSPDRALLASSAEDGVVRLWDMNTGQSLGELSGRVSSIHALAFSPDGRTLVAIGDKALNRWDVESREAISADMLDGPGRSVAYSPDGNTLATGNLWGRIELWDAESLERLAGPIDVHLQAITSLAFSPDGRTLVSGSFDSYVGVLDVRTGQQRGDLLPFTNAQIFSVAFDPNGNYFAAGSFGVQVWDANTLEVVNSFPVYLSARVQTIVFTPSDEIVFADSGNHLAYWYWNSGGSVYYPLPTYEGAVEEVAVSADGLYFASGSGQDIVVWDGGDDYNPLVGQNYYEGNFQGFPSSIAVSPDGATIVTGDSDGQILLWDAQSVQVQGTPLTGHTDEISDLAISPDGQRLASASYDSTFRLWDMASHTPIGQPVQAHRDAVLGVVFSPDGEYLGSTGWDNTVAIWSAKTGDLIHRTLISDTWYGQPITFSPDSKWLAVGASDGAVYIYDVATGQLKGEPLRGHIGVVYSVAFSPDGKLLASGSQDSTIRLWDVDTGQPVGSLSGHTSRVFDLSFMPSGLAGGGLILASASGDTTMRLWDVAARQPLGPPLQANGPVFQVTFFPEGQGQRLAAVGLGTFLLRDLSPEVLIQQACRTAGRDLTQEEWRLYMPESMAYTKTCEQ